MSDEKKTYEGMFLLDAGVSDFQAASEPIQAILERSEVETLTMKPWDERRLAYEIDGRKRGLYVLAYFRADPNRIKEIEHDCQLNEQILRIMILRKDTIDDETLGAETPADVIVRRTAEAEARKVEAEKAEAEKAEAEAAAAAEKPAEAAAAEKPTEAATAEKPAEAAAAEKPAEAAAAEKPAEAATAEKPAGAAAAEKPAEAATAEKPAEAATAEEPAEAAAAEPDVKTESE